jgi:hypothetical protein
MVKKRKREKEREKERYQCPNIPSGLSPSDLTSLTMPHLLGFYLLPVVP